MIRLLLVALVVATAPASQLIADPTTDQVYLAAERLIAERAYPPEPVKAGAQTPDEFLLEAARRSNRPAVRVAAVRALARFEDPSDIGRLGQHIADPNKDVRAEVIAGLAFVLRKARPVEDARTIAQVFDLLRARLLMELELSVREAILASLGELPLAGRQAAEAERILLERIKLVPASMGAVRGIEAWYRRHQDWPMPDAMRARLRQLSVPRMGAETGWPIVTALEALRAIGDTDERTITTAAAFRCPPPAGPECGWDVRLVAVQLMRGAGERFSLALHRRLDDAHHPVRLEAVRSVARSIPSTRSCAPLIGALSDASRHVVLAAIDLLSPSCDDREDALSRLRTWAKELGTQEPEQKPRWHERAQALVTLAKFAPDEAVQLAEDVAEDHEFWQVRAAAARVAEIAGKQDLASRLARDDEPNVRTAALDALTRMGSPARVPAAIAALDTDDVQLVLTAAQILKKERLGALAERGIGADGWNGLAHALMRFTASDREPTREARVEILARLAEWGPPGDTELKYAFRGYMKDSDPVVAAAASDALYTLTGERVPAQPVRRPIEQPTEGQLTALRARDAANIVNLHLSDGSAIRIVVELRNVPLTSARFIQLAEAGYYNGLTFHRVAADVMMAGGSPGANDYSGDRRFWRDEIRPSAGEFGTFGLVGLAARERHTGAGQFFITTHPGPDFIDEHTIFGRACVSPRIMEGAVIIRVSVAVHVFACQF